MKKFLFLLLAVGFIGWSARSVWYSRAIQALDDASTKRISIQIPVGSSTEQIARLLEEQEIIKSASAFVRYAQSSDLAGKLQAGEFVLRPSMDVSAIAEALLHGKAQEEPLTIPEGFTVRDIDSLLAEKGLIQAGDFSACAVSCDLAGFDFLPQDSELAQRGGRVEGYLFPDTYFVARTDFSTEAFLKRLLSNFRTRVIDVLGADIAASKYSLHEVVTMASLVEEETRTNDERAVVAGILWKRLREGMRLDVDAAVRYVVNKPTAAITRADLATDSPYNLRLHGGLPPGPIASPGLASIRATLQPESSQYYFYLHGTDGRIRYAVTNEEHNANKARYLR